MTRGIVRKLAGVAMKTGKKKRNTGKPTSARNARRVAAKKERKS